MIALETGAVAIEERLTEPPTLTSVGLADMLAIAAQLNVWPLTRVTIEPPVATVQASWMLTVVVWRATMSNGAAPEQVTLPSLEVPEMLIS